MKKKPHRRRTQTVQSYSPGGAIPWTHPSPQPKRHLDRFRHFCRAHDRERQTVLQTVAQKGNEATTGMKRICFILLSLLLYLHFSVSLFLTVSVFSSRSAHTAVEHYELCIVRISNESVTSDYNRQVLKWKPMHSRNHIYECTESAQ